jgi:hypothetical protein
MHVHARRGALVVRFGSRFAAVDAERASETILALAPFSLLTLDFTHVQVFENRAIVPLAEAVGTFQDVEVRLKGLTRHHARIMQYLGLSARSPATAANEAGRELAGRR